MAISPFIAKVTFGSGLPKTKTILELNNPLQLMSSWSELEFSHTRRMDVTLTLQKFRLETRYIMIKMNYSTSIGLFLCIKVIFPARMDSCLKLFHLISQ